jgi:hypothetical protein
VFVPGKHFQLSLMSVGNTKSLPLCGTPEISLHTRLERIDRDKHSSLLQTFISYSRKRLYHIGPRSRFYGVIITNMHFMLSIAMLNVIILIIIMLSIIMLNIIVLCLIMLNVLILSVLPLPISA